LNVLIFCRFEELGPEELSKSPSFSMTKSLNDSKVLDTTTSLKKVTLADTTSIEGKMSDK